VSSLHAQSASSCEGGATQLNGAGFDVVLVELFGSLCYGATLVLKDAADPFEHLKHVHATMATPSLLSACSPEEYGNLDTIALAGEPVPQALADSWAERVYLMNLYGPSEVRCLHMPWPEYPALPSGLIFSGSLLR
jgi:gliotoxin/aspirochlorine biosynthesis peptide synthetase